MSDELREQLRRTKNAIEDYKSYGKATWKTRWEVNIDGTWNWGKVIEDMNTAVASYERIASTNQQDTKVKKCLAFVRKCARSFSSNAETFQN